MSKRKQKTTKYGLESQVTTLLIKCYEEQMKYGWEGTKERIKEIDSNYMGVTAIGHDRDNFYEDFWEASIIKKHFHFVCFLRRVEPSGRIKRVYVKKILNDLGIEYRPDLDKDLWEHHGVETAHDVSASIVYLMHETEQAILDGKAQYDIEEIVTNLDRNDLDEIIAQYRPPSHIRQKSIISKKELAEYDEVAYNYGFALHDWDEWFDTLPFAVRDSSSIRTIQQRYERGLCNRINLSSSQMVRLCIFIQGGHNQGKTYAAEQAMISLKKRILPITEAGSGSLDKLKATTDALIVDDAKIPNILNMSDNKICQAYRRNANNPYWCGKYLIITSNNTFNEYINTCGRFSLENQEALKSRFFICHIEKDEAGNKTIYCDSQSERGTEEVEKERCEMYIEFAKEFNKIINTYKPREKNYIIDCNEMVCPQMKDETENENNEKAGKEKKVLGQIEKNMIPYFIEKGFSFYEETMTTKTGDFTYIFKSLRLETEDCIYDYYYYDDIYTGKIEEEQERKKAIEQYNHEDEEPYFT